MTRGRTRRQGAARIFAMPALLAGSTVLALAIGLVRNGGWDLAAAAGLILPLAALGQLWRPRRAGATKRLQAQDRPVKSAPHPRSPAPLNAERA